MNVEAWVEHCTLQLLDTERCSWTPFYIKLYVDGCDDPGYGWKRLNETEQLTLIKQALWRLESRHRVTEGPGDSWSYTNLLDVLARVVNDPPR